MEFIKIIIDNEYIMLLFPIAVILLFFLIAFLFLGTLKILFRFFNRNVE
jgi:hypothetical protein